MNYINGRDILPPDLLKEIQKHINGELIYIPKIEEKKVSWGALSGAREHIEKRNVTITEKYKNGFTIERLQEEYCLSEASIRKIIYKHSNRSISPCKIAK